MASPRATSLPKHQRVLQYAFYHALASDTGVSALLLQLHCTVFAISLCSRQSLLLAAAAAAFPQVSRTEDGRGHQDDGRHKAGRVDVSALSTVDGRGRVFRVSGQRGR